VTLSPIKLSTLQGRDPIVEPKTGRPTNVLLNFINGTIRELKRSIGSIQDAINAADTATAAAATAVSAAATATAATAETAAASALTNSYPTGLTITATDAGASVTIAISAHTRNYPQADGTNVPVAVTGGTVTGQPYTTDEWVYYDDPPRTGGVVTYHATATQATSAQVGDRHAVGAVTTPAAAGAPVVGKFRTVPGTVEP
jgi:hypothetical protein